MTQVQEHAPSVSELFGEEEEEEFSEEEEDDDEGEEDEYEEYEEGDSQNSNNSSFSAHSDGEKKDFNYTQDRLDAARRKLKEKYGELKAQKDKRTIVTLDPTEAPNKRRRTALATYQAPPPTLTKAAPPSNVKSKTSPPLSASPSVCT